MALPKVGVEAVIEGMAKFESDSSKINRVFSDIDTATGKLGKSSSGLTSHLSGLGSSILNTSKAIGGMATIAGGIIAANLFGKITEGLISFASAGL
jgi:hypothetical protein